MSEQAFTMNRGENRYTINSTNYRGSGWSGTVHGVGQCVEWGSAWSEAVRGVGQCEAWGSAERGTVHGVGQCVEWGMSEQASTMNRGRIATQ